MLKFNLKSKIYSNSQIASHDVKLIDTKNPQINKSLFSRFGRAITNICNVFKKPTVSQKSNEFQMKTISGKDFAKKSCISFPEKELNKTDKNRPGYEETTYHVDIKSKITGKKYKSTDQPKIQITLSDVNKKTIETSSRSQINSKKSGDELPIASFSGAGNTEKETSTVSTMPSITHEEADEFKTKIREKIEYSYYFKSEALFKSNWAIDKNVQAICVLAARILFSSADNAFKYDTNQASGVISLKKRNDFTEIQSLISVNKNSSGDLVSINTFDQFLIEHAAKNSDSGIITVENRFFNKTNFDKKTPEKYKEMGFQLVDNNNKHYGHSKVCMLLDLNKSPLWEKDSNGQWCFKETNQ